jgi:branched-chain amino acid transport system substrate-binding protein
MKRQFHNFLRKSQALVCGLAVLGFAAAARAKDKAPQSPYASIGSKGVSYSGPGRDSSYDLPGTTVRIGLVAPLRGPEKPAGDAIVVAARMALQDVEQNPLPGGQQLVLAIGDESVPPWGQFANVLIHLVLDEQAVAVVTSSSGVTTHLSEQIGNRIGVPILTLSTDPTTTQIDLPWIFRLGPSDALQAQLFAQDIFRDRGLESVLLVAERGHDGRVGGEEFQRALRTLGAPSPASIAVDPLQPDAGAVLALIKARSPQAIVFWTCSETASRLLQQIRQAEIDVPVYLSQEAAQEDFPRGTTQSGAPVEKDIQSAGVWTVESAATRTTSSNSFAQRYESKMGKPPSPVAAEAYDAVCLVVDALRAAGANRARVRDQLARVKNFSGASGIISFDNEGNNRSTPRLVRIQ